MPKKLDLRYFDTIINGITNILGVYGMSDISKLMNRISKESAPMVAKAILKEVREDKELFNRVLTSPEPYRTMIFETSVIDFPEVIEGNDFYVAVYNELIKAGEK